MGLVTLTLTHIYTHFIKLARFLGLLPWLSPLFFFFMQFSFFHVKVFTRFSSPTLFFLFFLGSQIPNVLLFHIRQEAQANAQESLSFDLQQNMEATVMSEQNPIPLLVRSYICRKNRKAYSETQIHNSYELFRLDQSRFQYQRVFTFPFIKI